MQSRLRHSGSLGFCVGSLSSQYWTQTLINTDCLFYASDNSDLLNKVAATHLPNQVTGALHRPRHHPSHSSHFFLVRFQLLLSSRLPSFLVTELLIIILTEQPTQIMFFGKAMQAKAPVMEID